MTDVPGKVGQDDVGCLRGPGHRRLDKVEVGLVSHLLAVIIQLLEILCVQRRQSLARVLRLGAAKLCEISLLVPSSLKKSEIALFISQLEQIPHLEVVLAVSDQHNDPVSLAGGSGQLLLVSCLLLVCGILLQRLH